MVYSKGLKIILVFMLGLIGQSLFAFPLQLQGIDTLRTAVLIRDVRFGVDIVSSNIDKSLIPASVMKTVTVASMLNLADGSERFSTPVISDGEIKDSVLDGNLIVKVCGDPTIESRYLYDSQGFVDSIVSNLKRMDVSVVRGDVIVDDMEFIDATTPQGWMDEDIPWPYGARLQGANFRDNRFILRLPSKETEPFVPDLKFSQLNRKSRRLKIDRKDGSEVLIINGNARRGFSDEFSMPFPSKVMRHEIITALGRNGISVRNEKVDTGCETFTVYNHKSPIFEDIMRSLMFRSDNLMAEGMLRAIRPGATRHDAIKEELAVWSMAGISAHGIEIKDGSGLSRDNRLTARFLADVYQYMMTDPFANDFTSLFPKAGYDGTMRNFLVGTELEGRVAMKTGSMRGVQSYAGYLFDEDGVPTHIMVFIVNNFRCGRAALKKDIERLLLEKFDVSLQSETENEDINLSDEERYDEPVEFGL